MYKHTLLRFKEVMKPTEREGELCRNVWRYQSSAWEKCLLIAIEGDRGEVKERGGQLQDLFISPHFTTHSPYEEPKEAVHVHMRMRS